MADGTKIEWTDATVNAVNGCSVVSPGCTNCYAMRLAGTRLRNHPSRAGLTRPTKAGPVWTGEVRLSESAMLQPLRWRRPRSIFWNAHGDLFHPAVPDEWIDRQFAVMALTPHHIHQVLTKRPERARRYIRSRICESKRWARLGDAAAPIIGADGYCKAGECEWPLPNVWLGVSVEDQARADERIPALLETPAAVRFLSCEPLLGPVDLSAYMPAVHHHPDNRDRNSPAMQSLIRAARAQLGGGIDWIIVGGESGPGARPMHPDWARSIREQCAAAGVAFFFKQWGEWLPVDSGHPALAGPRFGAFDHCPVNEPGNATHIRVGKKKAGRLLDGIEHNGAPC